MSVELQDQRKVYTGNGTATDFPFPFTLEDGSQVRVVVADMEGHEATLTYGEDYTVTFDEEPSGITQSTGSVSLASPLPAGYKIALISNILEDQQRTFPNNTPYYQEQVEGGIDKNTRLIQQIREDVNRAIKVPVTSSKTADEYMAEFKDEMEAAVDAAQSAAEDAAESRDDAADILRQCQEIADSIVVSFNNQMTTVVMTTAIDVPSGTTITLPEDGGRQVQYEVGSHALQVFYNGAAMFPGSQYEEVGTDGDASDEVKLLQELRAGDELMFHVFGLDAASLVDGESIQWDPETGLSVNIDSLGDYIAPTVRDQVDEVIGEDLVDYQKTNTRTWSAGTDYNAGALVTGSDGNLYVALSASGPSTTAVNPVSDATGVWGMIISSAKRTETGNGLGLAVHGGQTGRALVLVDNDKDGEDEDHRIALDSNSAGNAGIYDYTNQKWLIWCDKYGLNRVPGNTSIYSPDNGGTTYHNLSYVPMLDVRDFGAVGDGTTDDSSAIQAALDRAYATGKAVLIPAGRYLINYHLVFKSNTTVYGYGAEIVRGYDADSSNVGSTAWVRHSTGETVCHDVHIFGLTFNNNAQNYHLNSQNVVSIQAPTNDQGQYFENISFIDCIFENWINQHALDIAQTKKLRVINCVFRDVLYVVEMVSDSFAWNRWEAIQYDGHGIDISNQDWVIDGCIFEAHNGESITFPADSYVGNSVNTDTVEVWAIDTNYAVAKVVKLSESGTDYYYALQANINVDPATDTSGKWQLMTRIDGRLCVKITENKTVAFAAPRTGIGQHSANNYTHTPNIDNLKITNCTFSGCGYAAVTLYASPNSIVANNYMYDCYYGIMFDTRLTYQKATQTTPATLYRLAPDNCKITHNYMIKPSTSASYHSANVNAVGITTRIIKADTDFSGVTLPASSKLAVSGLSISDNFVTGYSKMIGGDGVFDMLVVNNDLDDMSGYMITISGARIKVTGNRARGNGSIYIPTSYWAYAPYKTDPEANKDIMISDNIIYSTIKECAFNIEGPSNVSICGNHIDDTYTVSSSPYNSSYFRVTANKSGCIKNNTVHAVFKRTNNPVAGSATGNAIESNAWFVNGVLQS